MTSPREVIIRAYSEWTAFSATRSGCPVKSREAIYPLIRTPDYGAVLFGEPITRDEFEQWHEASTLAIHDVDERLPIGWAAKLINMYLKTRVYVAQEGRTGLIECIHPPIDRELWRGIEKACGNETMIMAKTHLVRSIKEISSYCIYKTIIEGCRLVARKRGCYLIEIEELWEGTRVL